MHAGAASIQVASSGCNLIQRGCGSLQHLANLGGALGQVISIAKAPLRSSSRITWGAAGWAAGAGSCTARNAGGGKLAGGMSGGAI